MGSCNIGYDKFGALWLRTVHRDTSVILQAQDNDVTSIRQRSYYRFSMSENKVKMKTKLFLCECFYLLNAICIVLGTAHALPGEGRCGDASGFTRDNHCSPLPDLAVGKFANTRRY